MSARLALRRHGSVLAAAKALGVPRPTFYDRLVAETGGIRHVVAIGDIHDKPGRSKDRALWLGRFVKETDPDIVIQIGDLLSLNSLSQHETRGSRQDREAPTFVQDLDSADEFLGRYHEGCPLDIGIPHHITKGNHEYRADKAAEENPRAFEDAALRLNEVFARYRWNVTDYQKWHFYEGVGFTHVPSNLMGRAMGGVNVCRNVANLATHSIVFGHTHRFDYATAAKIGLRDSVQVVNLGTAMPWGEREAYTPDTSPTGWTYGAVELKIKHGQIIGHSFISMPELEKRYG